jgi:hypothetical protein
MILFPKKNSTNINQLYPNIIQKSRSNNIFVTKLYQHHWRNLIKKKINIKLLLSCTYHNMLNLVTICSSYFKTPSMMTVMRFLHINRLLNLAKVFNFARNGDESFLLKFIFFFIFFSTIG